MTLGELRELIATLDGLPNHYQVLVDSSDIDAMPADLLLDVLEGDTSDGPGSVLLKVR